MYLQQDIALHLFLVGSRQEEGVEKQSCSLVVYSEKVAACRPWEE